MADNANKKSTYFEHTLQWFKNASDDLVIKLFQMYKPRPKRSHTRLASFFGRRKEKPTPSLLDLLDDELLNDDNSPEVADIEKIDFSKLAALINPSSHPAHEGQDDAVPGDIAALLSEDETSVTDVDSPDKELIVKTVSSEALKNERVAHLFKMRRHTVDDLINSARLEITIADVQKREPIQFTFRNTACELVFMGSEAVCNDSNADSLTVFFQRPAIYYRKDTEAASFPCKFICAADDEALALIGSRNDNKELCSRIVTFSNMLRCQRDFVRGQATQPIITEKEEAEAEEFIPITDKNQLALMFEICKYTLPINIRTKATLLFEQLNSHSFGSEKNDILSQLSCMLSVDTYEHKRSNKSYDEIMGIFDRHIFGMEELKEEIAEFIIASQYAGNSRIVLLLVGPPGVGKTSVVQAIAECRGKSLGRVDCSGIDAVAMMGLVRSYNGAKPGELFDVFYAQGRADRVVLCDEIDKVARDKESDPNSIFIKALGPEMELFDKYVAEPIDVSCTDFICTANDLSKIPGYVLNRFGGNIFFIDPYRTEEKVEIAKKHIIPKLFESMNIKKEEITFTDEALITIAEQYTVDCGAREMEDYIERLLWKIISGWTRGMIAKPATADKEFVLNNLKKHSVEDYQRRSTENTRKRKAGF